MKRCFAAPTNPIMPPKNFHVRQAAASALHAWADGHDYAETLVERHAHRRQLSSQDRGLLQAILLGVLRNRRLLDHWIGKLRNGKLDPDTRDILRVGLCQLFILGLPEHAAVHETVEVGKANVRGLINAVLRRSITQKEGLLAAVSELSPPVALSHPDWMFSRWKSQFGKADTIALMTWNNQPAETFARVNPLRGETPEIDGTPVEGAPGFFRMNGPLPTALLAAGQVYIQDPATRHSVELLDPKPGESILDACAAPGGKAFLIASKLGSAETLTCTDSNEKRLPRLQENLQRLGCGTAPISVHDWTQPAPEEWHGKFDAILLDVPCSNTGVIRRRVDVRWRLQPDHLKALVVTQRAILENALPCLKAGGRLIYSTCSIDADENEKQIESFLSDYPELKLTGTRQALPFRDGTDGAYAARLETSA